MGVKRILLAVLLALALAPGTFFRSEIPPPDLTSPVSIVTLDFEPVRSGPLVLDVAWKLTGAIDHFGGYSAHIAWKKDEYLAANDAGRLIRLSRPDRPTALPTLESFLNFQRVDKSHVDVESLTFDPVKGEV